MPHVHAGTIDALKVFAVVIILGALWRTVSAHHSDTPIGQAMAYIY